MEKKRKTYQEPSTEQYEMEMQSILAGSTKPGGGFAPGTGGAGSDEADEI